MSEERALSSYGVSVGTGLALETFIKPIEDRIDDDREIPKGPLSLDEYNAIYLNVDTLARSYVESYPREELFTEKHTLEFISEIELFISLILTGSNAEPTLYSRMTPTGYHPSMMKIVSIDRLRVPKTDIQKVAHRKMQKLTLAVIEEFFVVKIVSTTLPYQEGKHLVHTHHPLDLFSPIGATIHLWEAHTGAIKPPELHNTKYYPVKGFEDVIAGLPFVPSLYRVLGDKTTVIPYPIKIRREMLKRLSDAKVTLLSKDSAFKPYIPK